MNILVVGNGFDLAHGLPTRYTDFLDYVGDYDKWKDSTMSEEIRNFTQSNRWYRYFNSIYLDKKARGIHNDNWVDFENEMSKVLQQLDMERKKLKGQPVIFNPDVHQLKTFFETIGYKYDYNFREPSDITPITTVSGVHTSYILDFEKIDEYKSILVKDLEQLIACLEEYLSTLPTHGFINRDIEAFLSEIKPNYVLTFNFTAVYEKKYSKSFHVAAIHHIHGKIRYVTREDRQHPLSQVKNNNKCCNMVLGIGEYLNGDEKNNDNEFIQFKKFYQRIFNATGENYAEWIGLAKFKQEELQIHIYGHSLDTTDGDVFNKLICTEDAKTIIYYHSKNSLGNQIANLVKIIGEDKLIEMTGNGSVVFDGRFCEKN